MVEVFFTRQDFDGFKYISKNFKDCKRFEGISININGFIEIS